MVTDKAPDHRPTNCRFRLQEERKPYPRSSCAGCGRSIVTGLGVKCSKETDRIQALEAERDEARRRRDAWKAKAEGYDTIRNALREKVGAPWPPNLSRGLWAALAADEKKRADDAEAERDALREALPDEIDIYRLLKKHSARSYADAAKVIATHLAALQEKTDDR